MTGPGKPTKISFVYSNSTDPDAFETAYSDQIALAQAPRADSAADVEGLAEGRRQSDPAYRLLELYFADYAAASAAAAEAGPLSPLPSSTPPET